MTQNHKPLNEDELAEIMALDKLRDDRCTLTLRNADAVQIQNLKVTARIADWVPALVESVREARARNERLALALSWALVEVEVNGKAPLSELKKAQEVLASRGA